MTNMRGVLVLVISAALIAGACSGGGNDSDDAGRPANRLQSEASDRPGTTFPTVAADIAEPIAPEQQQSLQAGSVDDNADLDSFLEYLDRIRSSGVELRDYDPTGRVIIAVTDTSGLPVSGAEIVVRVDGQAVAGLRTTADGTARFHPALHGQANAQLVDIEVDGRSVSAEPGSTVAMSTEQPGGLASPVPLDILFLLDATGSMGDEIDRLKTSIDSVAARIDGLAAGPDVRFGMTLYRDEGDAFVTRTVDFTGNVSEFRSSLATVSAQGGGDYPEALDEGLAEALTVPSWRDPADTIQLIFLVADAPPQVRRQVDVPYPASIRDAISRGVKIFPVASSESDDQAEAVFRQLAQATGARFVFLSYGAGGAATGGSTDIASTDYEQLALDDLIVRLVAEELAVLDGTTTTRPDGQ